MTLSKADIIRIEKLGYNIKDFTIENEGFIALKNINGNCFFLKYKKCLIYENRPQGCRFYPLIYDFENDGFLIDDLCSHNDDFRVDIYIPLFDKIASFVNFLIEEKEQRMKEKEKEITNLS
jgi:Fe-S-cluster containining protein